MLDFYLLALAVARATEDASATSAFEDAVSRLAGYAHTLSDRQFHLPQLGDDDGGQLVPLCGLDGFDVGPALAIASALLGQPNLSDGRPREIVLWFTGELTTPRHVPDRRTSACLPDSGYVVSRTWRGDHLVMDVGPLGYLTVVENGESIIEDGLIKKQLTEAELGIITDQAGVLWYDRMNPESTHHSLGTRRQDMPLPLYRAVHY